jgi:ABC-2 type transport system permease protein
MSIFTVVRHTRGEEVSGRAELLRANVLGRHATLTAAVLLVLVGNLGAALLVMLGALSGGFAVDGSLLVAGSGASVGLFFGAVGAVSAQWTEGSRTASAVAGSVLGLSYLIRMSGDAAATGGTTLSWFSPLGCSQQTAPYVHDRWWPLLFSAGLTVAVLGWAFLLSSRRDLGAGLFPSRVGPARAQPSLGTPLGIARESLRGGLRGWGLALVLAGAMFGGYAQTMIEAAGDLPEQFQRVFTGESLMLGYLAYLGVFLAIFVAAAGVNGMQQIRSEEAHGRAALLLTSPLSRSGWLIAHLSVLLLGLALILLLVGLATGGAAAAVLHQDRAGHFTDLLLASLHQAPAVLAVVGVVVAVFGWAPKLTGVVGWTVLGYAAVMTNFGRLLELPAVMQNFNLFSHLAPYPVEPVSWTPILVLSALGTVGLTLGILGWQRREINSG